MPTTVVTRQGFFEVVCNAFAAFGFAPEAPVNYIFPSEMFLKESDLTPLEEHFDELLSGLLTWEPQMAVGGITETQMLEYEVKDYQTFYTQVNNTFARNQWRDSLLIVPPTEELVDWILTGTDMDPEEIVSQTKGIAPRGGIATVRSVAVCLAMAGGRPEYLPYLIAAVQAMTYVGINSGIGSWNSTTASTIPAFVSDGPAGKDIRLSSGYGCLGPDPVHPAGQVLGRAVRLVLQTLGGALPGGGSMSIFGGMRTTNAFFAEDEEYVPEGWTTWAEERGFARGQNVVTCTQVVSMHNLIWHFGGDEANKESLRDMAYTMAVPSYHRYAGAKSVVKGNMDLDTGLVLLPQAFVKALAEESGMSKHDVKQFLWDNSTFPLSKLKICGYWEKLMSIPDLLEAIDGEQIPVCPEPDQIDIVIAGGAQGGHGYFMCPVNQGDVCSIEVKLPKNWDDLLLDAEIDLGPIAS